MYCIHWFDLVVSKTMSQPPYTTIPLHPLCTASTASTGLTFLHQRNVPTIIYHYSTAYCVSTTTYHYCTVYCVHCVLWFNFFAPKTMSPPYTTIPLHPLYTASTASTPFVKFLHNLIFMKFQVIPVVIFPTLTTDGPFLSS